MQLTVEPEEHDPAALDLPRIVEKSKKRVCQVKRSLMWGDAEPNDTTRRVCFCVLCEQYTENRTIASARREDAD